MTFEQTLSDRKKCAIGVSGGRVFQAQQRATTLGVFEERQGSQCGWNRVRDRGDRRLLNRGQIV